jgi:hypothetical protein
VASAALSISDLYPDDRELFAFFVARFWGRVEQRGEDDCWPWKGNRIRAGYGRTKVLLEGGREISVYAHRLAFLFHHGAEGRLGQDLEGGGVRRLAPLA